MNKRCLDSLNIYIYEYFFLQKKRKDILFFIFVYLGEVIFLFWELGYWLLKRRKDNFIRKIQKSLSKKQKKKKIRKV